MATALSDLQRRVNDRMDQPQSEPYVASQSLTDVINEAYGLLWGIYTDRDPKFFETEVVITPTINVRDYALPADFRSETKVYCVPVPAATQATSTHLAMRRTMRDQYMGVPNQASFFYPTGSYIPTFEIMGLSSLGGVGMRLDPTPTVTPQFNIEVWYTPNYIPLANPTDTVDSRIMPGHDQFIVNQAAIMIKIGKEEQDASALMAMNEQVKQQIDRDLNARFMGTGKRIVNTDGYDGWVRGWDGWY